MPIPEQPQLSSSPTSIPSNADSSGPPSDSGRCRFIRPTSCALAMMSAAWVWCSSHSAARGLISFSAKERASARSSFCSSVSANETPPLVSTVAIGTLRKSRLTSQSMSVDGLQSDGQGAALRLDDVRVWRWHAASGTRKPIIDGLSWTVAAGERWALLGPNGAGKTTLLTIAGAVDFPSSGTVAILGETMGRTDLARLRESIGFVDTRVGGRFAPLLTVRQVVRTGRRRRSATSSSASPASTSTVRTSSSARSAWPRSRSGVSATAPRGSGSGR